MQLISLIKRIARDRRGVSAVEFALIAPFMVALYFGLSELTLAMMTERRTSHTASAIADLAAQDAQTTPAELDALLASGAAILKPFPATTLRLRVTSVRADAAAAPKVAWSRGKGLAARTAGATVEDFPANLLAANEALIMAEAEYDYQPMMKNIIPNTLTFKRRYYLKPRRSDQVMCGTC